METSSFERTYYEAESFWADGAVSDSANRKRLESTAGLLPSSCTSLLDVGCGNGAFGHCLNEVRPDVRVVGVDRSRTALSHVRFEHREASSDELPFGEGAFDCVSCLQVLEHLPVPVFEKTVRELDRVAKTHVIVSVPYREKIESVMTTCPSCKSRFNVDLHLRAFDDAAIRSLFSFSSLKLEKMIFPGSSKKLRWIDDALVFLRSWKNPFPSFLSPICPICGYSEGDVTALSSGAKHKTPSNSGSVQATSSKNGRSRPREILSKTFHAVEPFLPKEDVPGYWVVCLFSKQ